MGKSVVTETKVTIMDAILKHLLLHMSFLYNDYGFRIVDSMSSKSFGDGFLILQLDQLQIRFVSDRGQLFLEFRNLKFDKKIDWHSIDIVQQLVTGVERNSAELDDESPIFIQTNLNTICDLFSTRNAKKSIKKMKELESIRAKRIFG